MSLSFWCGELHAVAFAECPLRFVVECDSVQPTRVVGYPLAIFAFDRDQVFLLVHALDSSIFRSFDAMRFAAFRVAHDIAGFILRGPLSVCARDLLPG